MTDLTQTNEFDSLPSTWFAPGVTFEQIRYHFQVGKEKIRIASGFFTLRGWGLIRRHTAGKHVYLLVGIHDPGEDRARAALIHEIMLDLRTGLDRERRQSVRDLVTKMESGQFRIVDARAMDHHGKIYLVDNSVAIITSANTTGRGFIEQIETGDLVTDPQKVTALVRQFDAYFAIAIDLTQELLEALKRWLQLASPWDIYLKTMLALEDLQLIKNTYKKRPASYQVDMIAQTLRYIREHGGSMLVASTGLGKTVVAIHVALHLRFEDEIDNVMVISPKAVHRMWERELLAASLAGKCFTRQALDRKKSNSGSALKDFEEIAKSLQQQRWLIIIDESHYFRNRYVEKWVNKELQKVESQVFKRLREIVQTGNAKVLLLTASPYGKDIQNLNDQLFLLPHTAPNRTLFEEPEYAEKSWQVDSVDEFINLPVVSQLTTPHVARYYGKTEGQDIYIEREQEKLYIPKLRLHSIHFQLPLLESNLTRAIVENYFDLNSYNPKIKKLIDRLVRVAWTSSPLALRGVLERVIDTPGGPNEYDFFKVDFVRSGQRRRQILASIVEQLKRETFADDRKLLTLLNLLENVKARNEKAIVFCERRSTVVYLVKGLKELMPSLRVVGTVAEVGSNNYQLKETREIEELIKHFAPIANEHERENTQDYEDYDVFISTDAHGVGVNMQDASVVFNYDIDWTPIGPIQRAGRILRFWSSPRTVDLYTFVPVVAEEHPLKDELARISQRWENLIVRHDESRRLVDLPVLTANTREEIYLPSLASRIINLGQLNLEALADLDISPYYQHTAKLQVHRQYAESIGSDIISAKTYKGENVLIYVLLKHNSKYHGLVYHPEIKQMREPDVVALLDLLACTEDTKIAFVDFDRVEQLSDACINAWCEREGVNPKEVTRECALYLKPEGEGDNVKDWLNPEQKNYY